MRRLTWAFAALALAGCEPAGSPAAPAASATPAPRPFPAAAPAYAIRFKAFDDGVARDLTVYADAGRLRVDGPPPPSLGAQKAISVVFDPATGKALAFRQDEGAPKLAIVVEPSQLGAAGVLLALNGKAGAHAIGADQVAGLACQVFRFDATDADGRQVCVTEDGVILRVSATATPANPTLQAETIKRGPQAATLFALPPGYEVIDYGPCTAMASEAMTSAHAGQAIDKRTLAECETLGQKVSSIFSAPN